MSPPDGRCAPANKRLLIVFSKQIRIKWCEPMLKLDHKIVLKMRMIGRLLKFVPNSFDRSGLQPRSILSVYYLVRNWVALFVYKRSRRYAWPKFLCFHVTSSNNSCASADIKASKWITSTGERSLERVACGRFKRNIANVGCLSSSAEGWGGRVAGHKYIIIMS